MADELLRKTAVELSRSLAEGEVGARELMTACLERATALEPTLHCFNSCDADAALALADAADTRRAKGESRGPLDGIPVTLKDLIAVSGQPLTCSSKMLADYISPYDAHVTERLRAAGACFWGRLNMDEFAMGSSTENSATGPTRNPWNVDCVPGGSSGGCAAAVVAGYGPLSLGSDTGGSIRQPGAFCGCVGLKPTYGRVSRYGLVAFASSLDQIGPFARTVEDCALALNVICGHDRRDSTSFPEAVPDFAAPLGTQRGPWRIGVPKEYFGDGLAPGVKAAVDAVLNWYEGQGHTLVEVSLPRTDLAVPVYYILAPAEASSNLARYDGVRYGHRSEAARTIDDLFFKSRTEGFGEEVKRRIILGTYALSSGYYDAYYKKAQQVRALIRDDFTAAFAHCDVLLTPTTQDTAFRFGEKADDPIAMYLNDIYTINANLAGLPALSLPCGFDEKGLPVGFQLIGKAFAEADLLPVAHAYEQDHDWWQRLPEL
ncbi:MAG: Asp-tRNA(Asn)/Glu-tRNA(Gln) amidotransferase subunit GatA [Opitutales bacterium]